MVRTPVGDRYILERMLADGYSLGGEQSGHMIFLDYHTTGDGIISGLQMLKLVKRAGRSLSNLSQCMEAVPQVLIGVEVSRKPDLVTLPELQQAIRLCETTLNGTGRILVRYSGTESLVRVMVEGQNDSQIREVAEKLVGVVKIAIG